MIAGYQYKETGKVDFFGVPPSGNRRSHNIHYLFDRLLPQNRNVLIPQSRNVALLVDERGRRRVGTDLNERARAATHRGAVEGFGAAHDGCLSGACPGYDDAPGPASA